MFYPESDTVKDKHSGYWRKVAEMGKKSTNAIKSKVPGEMVSDSISICAL